MSIIYDGSHSVTFISGEANSSYNVRRSWIDFHLVPEKSPSIVPRQLRYTFVDVPFSSKTKDYTQTIVQTLFYEPTNGDWTFIIDHDKWRSWHYCKEALENFINGKRLYCVLEDDPQFKYRGRFTVSDWQDESDYTKVTIGYDIDGYHWDNDFLYDKSDVTSNKDTISDSWEEIAKSIQDGTYRQKYSIGDIKNVSYDNEYGNIPMQIVAFDSDINNLGHTIPITWLAKESLIDLSNMYSTSTSTQYWETNVAKLCESLYETFPKEVKSCIKQAKKYFYHPTYTDANTYCNIWIPSYREIYGGYQYEGNGPSYSTAITDRRRSIHGKSSAGGASWWLRTRVASSASNNYMFVSGSGNQFDASPTSKLGVVIGFCT